MKKNTPPRSRFLHFLTFLTILSSCSTFGYAKTLLYVNTYAFGDALSHIISVDPENGRMKTLASVPFSGRDLAVDSENGVMFFSTNGKVYTSDLWGNNLRSISDGYFDLGLGNRYHDLEVDPINQKIYFKSDDNVVSRANYDGSKPEMVFSHPDDSPERIGPFELHLSSNSIYFAETSLLDRIRRFDLQTRDINSVIWYDDNIHIRDLHIASGQLYWGGILFNQETDTFIQRADLDGDEHETIIDDLFAWGLNVDEITQKVYWTTPRILENGESDVNQHDLYESNLDGSQIRVIAAFEPGISPRMIHVVTIPEPASITLTFFTLTLLTLRRSPRTRIIELRQ